MQLATYYAQNYAGIIGASLAMIYGIVNNYFNTATLMNYLLECEILT